MMQVYERGEWLFFSPMARTKSGFWASIPPYRRLERSTPRGELGRAVLDALDVSVQGILDPDPLQEADEAFLRLAQAETWDEFAEGTKMIMVEWEEGMELALVLTANEGPHRGFIEHDDLGRLSASVDDPVQVGDQLLAALQQVR